MLLLELYGASQSSSDSSPKNSSFYRCGLGTCQTWIALWLLSMSGCQILVIKRVVTFFVDPGASIEVMFNLILYQLLFVFYLCLINNFNLNADKKQRTMFTNSAFREPFEQYAETLTAMVSNTCFEFRLSWLVDDCRIRSEKSSLIFAISI